ncbi:hypothetical protein [Pseudomonas sp. BF-R-01]|nr:hypothetical protein [Pseudomonas sp. BF-R-01]
MHLTHDRTCRSRLASDGGVSDSPRKRHRQQAGSYKDLYSPDTPPNL